MWQEEKSEELVWVEDKMASEKKNPTELTPQIISTRYLT